jgi:O-acetyl-ADP-ribose deacetylase (regulator of RNase III)
MIEELTGNLLLAEADALVNTVNTVGVAGKGIALQFRQAFPENFRAYERAAKQGKVVPGKMFVWETGQLTVPRYIINFPTKRHWRGKSRIRDIEDGLEDLVNVIRSYDIRSVAVPPLGCGNGGLRWSEVRDLIIEHLRHVDAKVLLYAPTGAPDAEQMPIRTERPEMTLGLASLVLLLKQYREADSFRLSALEVQKLAYFLQASGEVLRLNYVPGPFGPYAENLNYVLQIMEGHFTSGYGDRSREPRLVVLDGAAEEARRYLQDHPATQDRLRAVSRLVAGWETPYALELLATVHWALTRPKPKLGDRPSVYEYVSSWTPRKAKLFTPSHIDRAIDQLVATGFASEPGPTEPSRD